MKKMKVTLLLGILFFMTGCDFLPTPEDEPTTDDSFEYTDSGISIGGDALYYRDYTDDTTCELFEVFLVFDEGIYYYAESFLSFSDSCASGLYVIDGEEYIELSYAYSTSVYTDIDIHSVSWGFTIYESYIGPTVVTLEELIAESTVTDQEAVLNSALQIENAANLYCACEECPADIELSWTQLQSFVEDFPEADYDFTNNEGIIAYLVDGEWVVDLERDGIGEWEFTEGLTPSTAGVSAVIIDVD